MGKIFKITGSYYEDTGSDPTIFKGRIVVGDNGSFRGYCNELHNAQGHRYLCGIFKQTMIMISNVADRLPALYTVNDSGENDKEWRAQQFNIADDKLNLIENCSIEVEQQKYSDEEADKILVIFNEADLTAEWNKAYSVDFFVDITSVLGC